MNKKILSGLIAIVLVLVFAGPARAATTCTFTTTGTTLTLDGDCTTDETILIPDGFTLNGAGYMITAVDPAGNHFKGAVVANAGDQANVQNLKVSASALANVCDAGADRLRGIMFEGASGLIYNNTVVGINQGPSGCQEGNAVEIRNEPFDGTHPATHAVEVDHNYIDDYQKTGIVANGDVDVNIHHNFVGDSATQANLAANSIQLGFGALGSVKHNKVVGNQWLGASDWAATAFLIFDVSGGVEVSQNDVSGNSDVGLYVESSDNGLYFNNKLSDEGVDGAHGDWGIYNNGSGNSFTNNKVNGFDTAYEGVEGGKNKTQGGPQDHDAVYW